MGLGYAPWHTRVLDSSPGWPSPKPEVKVSSMRSVIAERGSEASFVQYGKIVLTRVSSELIVPSATRPANIIAEGHLDVEAVGTSVFIVMLPPSYRKRSPSLVPTENANSVVSSQPSRSVRSGANALGRSGAARSGAAKAEPPEVSMERTMVCRKCPGEAMQRTLPQAAGHANAASSSE